MSDLLKWKEKAKRRDRLINAQTVRVKILAVYLQKAEKCLDALLNSKNIDDSEYEQISQVLTCIRTDTREYKINKTEGIR